MTAELLRILCNRPKGAHTLGTVTVATDGDHLVRFSEAVRVAIDRQEATSTTVPLSRLEGRTAYCANCNKAYLLNAPTLEDAIARKVRRLALDPVGFVLDPIGVLQRRGQR